MVFSPDSSFQDENMAPSAMSDFSDEDFMGSDVEVAPTSNKRGKKTTTATAAPAKKKKLLEESDKPNTQTATATTANTTTINSKKNASSQYQKLSQLEHVLKRPDSYIGSTEFHESKMWVFDPELEQMRFNDIKMVPGFYKIFDEILVNAADNKIRDPNMKVLKVNIDQEKNVISVYNDGKGIPIERHDKEKMYIPELIFGNLLTSSNYDDDEKKVTGGRNGYGAKVCFTKHNKEKEKKY